VGFITDILKEIPTSGVLKERVALAEQKYELLERENDVLKQENARLKSELEALRRKVPSTQFVEARGVLFKVKPHGGYEPDAYCPDCKRALWTLEEDVFPLGCSKCKYQAPIFKRDVAGIIAELQSA
jgi:hypothetical protein